MAFRATLEHRARPALAPLAFRDILDTAEMSDLKVQQETPAIADIQDTVVLRVMQVKLGLLVTLDIPGLMETKEPADFQVTQGNRVPMEPLEPVAFQGIQEQMV